MNQTRNFIFEHRNRISFVVLLILIFIQQYSVLRNFTFRFVDDDQSIMWYGAKEYAAGKFHEPYFFGQPYNTMFESMLAVPFLWIGASFSKTLTVVMSFVTFLPYVFLAFILFRKNLQIQALIVLSILLLLPVEFGMITSISRGCSVGVFFSGFALLQIYSTRKSRFFLFGFFSIMGLYANQNSALLLFPVGLILLLENYRNRNFYLHCFIGAIPPGLIWFFSNYYYKIHPENIVHDSWKLNFNTGSMTLPSILRYFNYVMPVTWGMGWMIFLLLLSIGFVLFRQKQFNASIATVTATFLLLFSLAINKVHDGYDTVFYSWSRMFIAVPLLLAILVSKIDFSGFNKRILQFSMLLPLTFFILKCATVSKVVHREVDVKKEHNMFVSDIPELETMCRKIQSISGKYQVDLIVIGTEDHKQLFNYACPCLIDSFPATIEPQLDRRTWVLKEEDGKIRKTILFVALFEQEFEKQLKINPALQKVSEEPLMYLLQNNHSKTSDLLKSLQMPMRKH